MVLKVYRGTLHLHPDQKMGKYVFRFRQCYIEYTRTVHTAVKNYNFDNPALAFCG